LVLLLLIVCIFLISQVVDFEFKVNKDKIKKISKFISAEPKNLPISIIESDMVGVTIFYPSGNTRRLIITVEKRDEIIDRQFREEDISNLVPRENEEGF
jgi:hypothetical protein